MTEIAELVSLWHDRGRASADVKRIAQRHLAELEQRIVALQDMRRTLDDLLCHCHGDVDACSESGTGSQIGSVAGSSSAASGSISRRPLTSFAGAPVTAGRLSPGVA